MLVDLCILLQFRHARDFGGAANGQRQPPRRRQVTSRWTERRNCAALAASAARGVGQRLDYYRRIYAKTASVFEAAAEDGAVAAHAAEDDIAALATYGREVGSAFQIVDDILDFVGDPAHIGKPVGGDLRQGLMTLPTLCYMEERPHDADVRALLNGRMGDAAITARVVDPMPFGPRWPKRGSLWPEACRRSTHCRRANRSSRCGAWPNTWSVAICEGVFQLGGAHRLTPGLRPPLRASRRELGIFGFDCIVTPNHGHANLPAKNCKVEFLRMPWSGALIRKEWIDVHSYMALSSHFTNSPYLAAQRSGAFPREWSGRRKTAHWRSEAEAPLPVANRPPWRRAG